MTRPPRQLPPSAIDGYRRLARTRHVAAASGADDLQSTSAPTLPPVGRSGRTRRFAGTLRLSGFIAVLALIIGTSASLAGTQQRGGDPATPARDTSVPSAKAQGATTAAHPLVKDAAAAVKADAAAGTPADGDDADAVAAEPVAASAVVEAPRPSPAARPAGALPFTGVRRLEWPLLGGSLLVLIGMLVQVAGQPLPARAHARRG